MSFTQRPSSRGSIESLSSEGSEPHVQRGSRLSPAPGVPAASTNPPDDEASVLLELQSALAADPTLREATPQPRDEWEDYERLLSQNPEIAKPVPGRKKQYYMSKDKWECGHEGEAKPTDIELEAGSDDGGNGKDSTLINDVRGICQKCMEKWTKLESGGQDGVGMGGSSRSPAGDPGLPSYDQVQDDDSEKGDPSPGGPGSLPRGGMTGWDEGPDKGKGNALHPDDYDDDSGSGFSDYSDDDPPAKKGEAARGNPHNSYDEQRQ